MIENIKILLTRLNEDLITIKQEDKPKRRVDLATGKIEMVLKELKHITGQTPFADKNLEIDFFKITKPYILSLRIYEVNRYNLEVNAPIGTAEIRIKYYEGELKAIQRFFRMNSFHYQYYKNGLTASDHTYFMRGGGQLSMPMEEIVEDSDGFSTPMSYLFSKFIAYEKIQHYIVEQIGSQKFPEIKTTQTIHADGLKWTGDAINVVELAYGIWLTGQLNNGNASLNQIVKWLETNLGVSIGIIQRRFAEIESRKRISTTKFLEQMMNAVKQKIDNGNA